MSTTIAVYPTTRALPLIEETRRRTEELYQQLLDRHSIRATVSIEATEFNAATKANDVPARKGLRWEPNGPVIAFAYFINGDLDSCSWPSCDAWGADDVVELNDLASEGLDDGYRAEFLGRRYVAADMADLIAADRLSAIESIDWRWSEYRNMGGPVISSIGYGLTAAVIAEQTDGHIASFDYAFDPKHNGETASQFLAWWGNSKLESYGSRAFYGAR